MEPCEDGTKTVLGHASWPVTESLFIDARCNPGSRTGVLSRVPEFFLGFRVVSEPELLLRRPLCARISHPPYYVRLLNKATLASVS